LGGGGDGYAEVHQTGEGGRWLENEQEAKVKMEGKTEKIKKKVSVSWKRIKTRFVNISLNFAEQRKGKDEFLSKMWRPYSKEREKEKEVLEPRPDWQPTQRSWLHRWKQQSSTNPSMRPWFCCTPLDWVEESRDSLHNIIYITERIFYKLFFDQHEEMKTSVRHCGNIGHWGENSAGYYNELLHLCFIMIKIYFSWGVGIGTVKTQACGIHFNNGKIPANKKEGNIWIFIYIYINIFRY
jgi:hypothetical protein